MENITNQTSLEKLEEEKEIKINLRLVNKILILLSFSFFVFYLIGTNDLTIKGFVLKDLKTKVSELSAQNTNLEIKTASLRSYDNLSKKISKLDLTEIKNVKYVKIEPTLMAKK